MKYGGPKDTVVQFLYYQPIRYQWRETDFFPCSVSCGGGQCFSVWDSNRVQHIISVNTCILCCSGYQLNSAECVDIRSNQTLPEHHCSSFPENTKPTPKLRECNMDPCLERYLVLNILQNHLPTVTVFLITCQVVTAV